MYTVEYETVIEDADLDQLLANLKADDFAAICQEGEPPLEVHIRLAGKDERDDHLDRTTGWSAAGSSDDMFFTNATILLRSEGKWQHMDVTYAMSDDLLTRFESRYKDQVSAPVRMRL